VDNEQRRFFHRSKVADEVNFTIIASGQINYDNRNTTTTFRKTKIVVTFD